MRSLLFCLACLVVPAQAEEVLRLKLPPGPESLPRLMEVFPDGNYTFDRRGTCYVAGDDLREADFPPDFTCVWLPLDVEPVRLTLKLESLACSRVAFRAVCPNVAVVLSPKGDFYALGAGRALDNPACPFRPLPLAGQSQPEAWVENLREVEQVDGPEGVGMGGSLSQAYMMLCCLQQLGQSAIPFFEILLRDGSPSARLMVCKALMQIGERERAERGWADLLECDEIVTWRSGCTVSRLSASYLARWQLEHPERNF